MSPSQDPLYAGLGQAVRIATDLLAALIVGGGLGWACDTYLFGSTPWGMIGGLVLGGVTGMRNAYRSMQGWPKT
jgi:ATP synthase protein I